jgi:hypothetical protein
MSQVKRKPKELAKPEWVKERTEALATEGFIPILRLEVGETKINVNMDIAPKDAVLEFEDRQVPRTVFRVNVGVVAYTLAVGKTLEYLILCALSKNINPMTIIRKGTGLQTQYSIKELKA